MFDRTNAEQSSLLAAPFITRGSGTDANTLTVNSLIENENKTTGGGVDANKKLGFGSKMIPNRMIKKEDFRISSSETI